MAWRVTGSDMCASFLPLPCSTRTTGSAFYLPQRYLERSPPGTPAKLPGRRQRERRALASCRRITAARSRPSSSPDSQCSDGYAAAPCGTGRRYAAPRRPPFINMGDLVDGGRGSPPVEQWFTTACPALLTSQPPSWGESPNLHHRLADSFGPKAYLALFDLNRPGSVRISTARYYSYDYGDVHFSSAW